MPATHPAAAFSLVAHPRFLAQLNVCFDRRLMGMEPRLVPDPHGGLRDRADPSFEVDTHRSPSTSPRPGLCSRGSGGPTRGREPILELRGPPGLRWCATGRHELLREGPIWQTQQQGRRSSHSMNPANELATRRSRFRCNPLPGPGPKPTQPRLASCPSVPERPADRPFRGRARPSHADECRAIGDGWLADWVAIAAQPFGRC